MRNKNLTLFPALRVLGLAFLLALPASATNFRCLIEYRLFSVNAMVPAKVYRQYATRTLKDLDQSIRPGFGAELLKAKAPIDILDVGGGYSLYGVQLAKAGHNVETVNAQNFYAEALYPATTPEGALALYRSLPQGIEGTYVVSETTMGSPLLRQLSAIHNVPLPKSLVEGQNKMYYFPNAVPEAQAAQELADFFSTVRRKHEAVEKDGRFKRVTKLAQEALPKIPTGSKDRIVDSFGAFYYSADRVIHTDHVGLISEYYRILRPGGKAEISISALTDLVKLPNGQTVDLYDALAAGRPDIFTVTSINSVRTLTVTRSEDPKGIDKAIKALGKPVVTMEEHGDAPVYPSLVFTLEPPK